MKKGRNSGNKDENEQKLWDAVVRSVKAYNPSKLVVMASEKPIRKIKAPPQSKSKQSKTPSRLPEKPVPRGFDRSTETKLKRGQLPLEGRIDLHGMSQTEAFSALLGFIRTAVAQKKRTVLVITGKGFRSGGVLRRRLPEWLAEPDIACYIVAVTPAQPKDGGTGAFYLRLRKQK